eukprot:283116_1
MALEANATLEAKVRYTLPNISSKDELLVNGYCRQVMVNFPKEITNYCIAFVFFGIGKDKFDIKNIGKYHTLKRNLITQNTDGWPSSSFLLDTMINGKHICKFKIKSGSCGIRLGIWKVNSYKPPTDDAFWFNNNNYKPATGYAYNVGAGCDHNNNTYGITCAENDIILMFLDFNKLRLSFKVNNIDYGLLSKIENTEYKA